MKLQVATVLATMALAAMAAAPPGIPDGWSDGFVYANGIRMHYYRAAPTTGKPVIVMVHGVTDNGLCWTTLTQELQKSYDIYMMDTRGHGLSDPFTDADTGETLIRDVVEFVRVMKFDKPILMGHSMGAATVMRVGAQYPDLAGAVIMLDPGVGRPGAGRPPGAPQAGGGPGQARPAASPQAAQAPRPAPAPSSFSMFGTPETLATQNNQSFEDFVARCGRQNSKWDPVDCQYWALSKRQYHGPYSTAQSQAMQGTMATGDSLARITAPALILKADAAAEARKAQQEAASVMQKGKLVHVDGAGHNLHHDQRKRTVEELTAFLNTL